MVEVDLYAHTLETVLKDERLPIGLVDDSSPLLGTLLPAKDPGFQLAEISRGE